MQAKSQIHCSDPAEPSGGAAGLSSAALAVEQSPLLLIDLDIVEQKFRALQAVLPEVEVLYAIKANPDPQILARLTRLGCGFDIASPGELALCNALEPKPPLLSYGNPIKKEADIAAAWRSGVGLFVMDSRQELEKIARAAPGCRVICRLAVSGAGAEWPLTHKFGCTIDQAVELLAMAGPMGVKPEGVSFHVGSQQTDPEAWRHAIHRAEQVFRGADRRGVSLEMLNLGGGLPAHYASPVPPLETYAEAIRSAVRQAFGSASPHLLIEPGRYMVGDAGVLVTEVVLVAERPHEATPRWVYLDAGVFSGLDETMGERIHYQLHLADAQRARGPVVLAGPTCDSTDVMYRHAVELPLDIAPGERVVFRSAGAYTAPCSTVAFNGFPPLRTQCL